MPKRIKHNDLTHYFLRQHSELPRAYLASCEKFFNSIKQQASAKQRAASVKQQATNRKEKMLEIFIIFTSLFILNMLGVFTVTI
jgi:hypothetical protein